MSHSHPVTKQEFQEFVQEIRGEIATLSAMARAVHPEHGRVAGGSALIQVNASGIGVWVASTCAAVMFVMFVPIVAALLWVGMNDRDKGHQINAIYQSVPGLRELVAEQMQLNQATKKAAANEEKPE